jgi:hypothetical protein
MATGRTRWLKTAGSILLVVSLLLMAVWILSRRWEPRREAVHSARLTISDPADRADVLARGWVSTNEISNQEEPLRLWISFENTSTDREVRGLQVLELQAPGFQENDFGKELPPVLKPGQSVTVPGTLLPREDAAGRYGLSVVYEWLNPAGGTLRRGLQLGPVEVTPWWREAMLGRRMHVLARDLALPLLAAALALLYQSREKTRELAQDRLQIWGNILQQFLGDAQTYYTPVWSSLILLINSAKAMPIGQPVPRETFHFLLPLARRTTAGGPKTRETFFHFLLFFRRMKFMLDHIASFNFQNRLGEEVAARAWRVFQSNVWRRFSGPGVSGEERMAQALEIMEPKTSLAVFSGLVDGRRHLQRLEGEFATWVADPRDGFAKQIAYLDLLQNILEIEINRPLALWYGEPEVFPFAQLESLRAGLPPAGSDEALKKLDGTLCRYIEKGKKEKSRP